METPLPVVVDPTAQQSAAVQAIPSRIDVALTPPELSDEVAADHAPTVYWAARAWPPDTPTAQQSSVP